jgi:hypothetical protein
MHSEAETTGQTEKAACWKESSRSALIPKTHYAQAEIIPERRRAQKHLVFTAVV